MFYTELRPYVHKRLAGNEWVDGLLIREANENQLSIEDRYFVTLDTLFGQIFKNVKTRQLWKQMLTRLHSDQAVSCLSIEALEKAYLNELVILFERLGRLVSLLRKAFRTDVDVTDMEVRLLTFFDPLLFTKRNYSHHRMYLGFRDMTELQKLEDKVTDQQSFEEYYAQFEKCVDKIVDWIEYGERELAELLKGFLELAHSKIQKDGAYIDPRYLTCDFSISHRLNVDIRDRYDHEKVFAEHRSTKVCKRPPTAVPYAHR